MLISRWQGATSFRVRVSPRAPLVMPARKEERMFGYNLIRLSLFILLAIVASTAVGLFTYLVVSSLAE